MRQLMKPRRTIAVSNRCKAIITQETVTLDDNLKIPISAIKRITEVIKEMDDCSPMYDSSKIYAGLDFAGRPWIMSRVNFESEYVRLWLVESMGDIGNGYYAGRSPQEALSVYIENHTIYEFDTYQELGEWLAGLPKKRQE